MKLVLIAMLFLAGCATGASRMVKSNKDGGRVMLIGTGSWMEPNSRKHADQEIKKKCQNGYEITEEGLMDRPADIALSGKTHVQEKYLDYTCK